MVEGKKAENFEQQIVAVLLMVALHFFLALGRQLHL
jgi:hypothetical protein